MDMEQAKILIVDDDPVVRDLLFEFLCNNCGYKTDVAFDGIDGVEKLKRDTYDVVFTDLTMPRANGIDLIRETRKFDTPPSVVVITGYSTMDNAINAMKEGARDFITKPFNFSTIKSIAGKIIGERRLLEKICNDRDNVSAMHRLNSELYSSLNGIWIFQSISVELDRMSSNREIYERIIEMAVRLLMVKEASFGILENGSLKVERSIGVAEGKIEIEGTFLERVVNSKSYYIASAGEMNPFNGSALMHPFFAIPFIMNEEVFAILSLSNKADGTAFSDYEIALAVSFAKKAELRIENNALYEVFYNNQVNTLKTLVTSIEARDIYTKCHSERVVLYSLQIADILNLGEAEKDVIRFGGYLHDIGKIGVRDTILLKPDRLTDDEMKEIKLHPVIGDNIIKPIRFFPRERELIRHHHENFDGKGYPDGLAGDKIPLIVRIIKVADTFDAMTSSRPYRKALSYNVAVDELKKYSNIQFDAELVRAFLQTPTGRGEFING